jgi:hypothetical protein
MQFSNQYNDNGLSANLIQIINVRRIILVILLFIAFVGKAQNNTDIGLCTDRDIYVSGENILFRIFLPVTENSGLVNVALSDTNGRIITEAIKKTEDNQANGFIYLPDSLKTGSYLLHVSTRKNQAATIRELFVCNRFNGIQESSAVSISPDINPILNKTVDNLKIEGLREAYGARQNVHVNMSIPGELLDQLNGSLLCSVAETVPGFSPKTFLVKADPSNISLKDDAGIILEGVAKDIKTGQPLQKGLILFSIPDSIPTLDYCVTGNDGTFRFHLLNYYGKIPFVVQGTDLEKKRLIKISIVHADTLRCAIPGYRTTACPKVLKDMAERMTDATTLGRIFNIKELAIDSIKAGGNRDYPFYGVPSEIVYPGLFQDLPDFTEISRELLIGIKFRANNRIPTLQMLNPSTQNYFVSEPLVTIDGVPVSDLNIIKNLGSKDIKRIEICRKERFYGDLVFPGVVAIYTSVPDYKLFEESDDLIKKSMNAYQPDALLIRPEKLKTNDPDLRKVLLWQPAVKTAETINIDFETSDIQGLYKLVVSGQKRDGSLVYKEQIFEVK